MVPFGLKLGSSAISKELRTYEAEMTAVRDKMWPQWASSLTASIGSGSMAALALSFLGGPGQAIGASIVAGSLLILKGALDLRAERNKIRNSAAPAVAYLSRVRARLR